MLIGLWAYHFPKIGVAFMPALDEGTTLDMPITVPRASVTQAADDLKARDALLRGFPEVESVIGKAGRADTPTDPAPLDMVETFVNFRPKELWPKRVLKYRRCCRANASECWQRWRTEGFVASRRRRRSREPDQRRQPKGAERFDETMRELACCGTRSSKRELEPHADPLRRRRDDSRMTRIAATLTWPTGERRRQEIDALTDRAARRNTARGWPRIPSLEDVTQLSQDVAERLADSWRRRRTWPTRWN